MKKISKKFVRSIFAIVVGIILTACGNSANSENENDVLSDIQESGVLTIGTAPGYPPLEFYVLDENGERQIAGSDITIAQAFADELGVELDIRVTDFNGVMANLQSASIDMGISGFTWTEERSKAMQFSEGYLQESSMGFQGIMMKEELAEKFSSLEEIEEADLTLGAQGGSIQYELAQRFNSEDNIRQYGTLDVGLAALNEGDIDAMLVASTSAEPMLTTFPDLVILPQEDFDLDPERIYSTNAIAFPLGEEYQSLIDLADEFILENIENGNIEKWHEEATELSREAVE